MRHFLESALAPVRRFRLVAQDGFASVVLCLLVVALVFEATPPRFLAGPLLNFAAPPAETYSAVAPRVMAGSPELDDAPIVEVADVVVSTPSLTETVQAEDGRQKNAGTAKTVPATDESGGGGGSGGGGDPTTSAGARIPPAPSPIGPCRGNASTNSTKHASSSGLRNGTGHGCG